MTEQRRECVATCRPGLEGVLAEELRLHGVEDGRPGRRCVYFSCSTAQLYRLNMAVRTAIQILLPLRTFNARDYDLLYFQARRTNWHQLFTVDKTLRIDVNGHSDTLRNTQYVVHRIKDGIVDTFRKLSGGIRPSVDKSEPEVHVVAHLDGNRVTLCLDSSGVPLFKRGYRTEHGEAPLKEDLAAGILLLSGIDKADALWDPVCGSGTFLFEGWMIFNQVAPNLHRSFSFQHWLDYQPEVYAAEKTALEAQQRQPRDPRPVIGCEINPAAHAVACRIRDRHFPDSGIEFVKGAFQDNGRPLPGALMVANPPYGERMGEADELGKLYNDLGWAARCHISGGKLAVFTTNRKAIRQIRFRSERTLTLFNGALEGLLYQYPVNRVEA